MGSDAFNNSARHTKGLHGDDLTARLTQWSQKNGRHVEMFRMNRDGETQFGYAQVDSNGQDRKYLVPGQYPGDGYRELDQQRFAAYTRGFDVDQAMPVQPLITFGDWGGTLPRNYVENNQWGDNRLRWTPPVASQTPAPTAQVAASVPVLAPTAASSVTIAAGPTVIATVSAPPVSVPVASAPAVTDLIGSGGERVNTSTWISDAVDDKKGKLVRLGDGADNFIARFENGHLTGAIARDANDPEHQATTLGRRDVETRLDKLGLDITEVERMYGGDSLRSAPVNAVPAAAPAAPAPAGP